MYTKSKEAPTNGRLEQGLDGYRKRIKSLVSIITGQRRCSILNYFTRVFVKISDSTSCSG